MVGRKAVLVIAALGAARAAQAGPITRGGVTWTAEPSVVRHDKSAMLHWTITARGVDARSRRVTCISVALSEEYGQLEKGRFVLGARELRQEPANACAPESPTTVTAKAPWRLDVPDPDHGDVKAGEVLRVRVELHAGSKTIPLAAVMLTVGDDGTPKLTTLAAKKP